MTFSKLYGANAHIAVNSIGAPGNAPPCNLNTPDPAVIVPSFFIPIFISMDVEEVGPVARKTSERLITNFTGLFVFFDKANATGSINIAVLPPKPPPISEAVTRSALVSISNRAAQVF